MPAEIGMVPRMKTCVNCGRLLDDRAILCPGCAAFQPLPPEDAHTSLFTDFFLLPGAEEEEQPQSAKESRRYLIWSIVLLFFCSFFGFPGLIASLQAYGTPEKQKRRRMLGFARGFCIAGTVLAALMAIFTMYLFTADPSLFRQGRVSG